MPNSFRNIALALPAATEMEHFGAPSFRVEGKIFAQLSADETLGLVKLTRWKQERAIATYADDCWSEPHWGKFGWTRLRLAELPLDLVKDEGTRWLGLSALRCRVHAFVEWAA